ncbi:MAG: YcaO-like family protein [Gaiellaceae bacterium]
MILHGRAHALVAPLIDGCRSEEEIVAALANKLPAAIVHLALRRLAKCHLIIHVPPGSVAVRPSESASGDVLRAFNPPGRGELCCVGVGVPSSIVSRLSKMISADANNGRRGLMLLVLDDYLRHELDQVAARCREHDVALLPIRSPGSDWWFGPFCDGAEAGPMWRLFTKRLHANRHADLEALKRGATFPLHSETGTEDNVADGDVAYAVRLVEQTLRGEPPESVVDGLLVLDCRDGRLTEHRIAVIAPPELHKPPAFRERPPALMRVPERRRADVEGGHRVCSPAATLARMTPLISPITGAVAGLERVPAPSGTHVYATAGAFEASEDSPGLLVFRAGALGKGLTDAQARASCMGEAIELLSSSFAGDEPRRRARWSEVEEIALHPRELLLISDNQYAQAATRPPANTWDDIPAPLDESQAIEWVPLVSLVSGERRWLPAAYCYFRYRDTEYAGPPYATASWNGCAAGNTREEAILHALLELIERDACAMWWYNRALRPGIDLDSARDDRLAAIRDAHAASGRKLAILDLRTDTEVTVVVAVAWAGSDAVLLPIGCGCHVDPTIAISRAITELSQGMAVRGLVDGRLPAAGATAEGRPYRVPDSSPPVRAADLPDLTGSDLSDEIDWCVQMLARLGHDVLLLDTTRADLGFPSVRVVVPGLRSLQRRLAPGRLYDVPVQCGWVPRRLREDELNSEAFGG